MKPVRPSIRTATGPPPERVVEGVEGANGGMDEDECDEDSIMSRTGVMDGDAANVRDLEGMDEANGLDWIDAENNDEEMEAKAVPEKLDPKMVEALDSRVPKALNAPVRPSADDVANHEITHTPPRPWCPVCVEAYGKEDPISRVRMTATRATRPASRSSRSTMTN